MKVKDQTKKTKKTKKIDLKIQEGGNVIQASIDLINSLKDLGKSIFTEINSITNISSDINTVAASQKNTPNDSISGPPSFKSPDL
jgi:hypothetical protein